MAISDGSVKMQITAITQNNGIFIQLPEHIMANVDHIISNFDDTTYEVRILFYPKQDTDIYPQVQALSGSLKSYIGTDNDDIDDEKALLQALLDDDNRIIINKVLNK